jgi:hypothetical protein
MNPNELPSDARFTSTALRARTGERKVRASSMKVISAMAVSSSGKFPYTALLKSAFCAVLPPTSTPPGTPASAVRSRPTVATPAEVLPSSVGITLSIASLPRRNEAVSGARTV